MTLEERQWLAHLRSQAQAAIDALKEFQGRVSRETKADYARVAAFLVKVNNGEAISEEEAKQAGESAKNLLISLGLLSSAMNPLIPGSAPLTLGLIKIFKKFGVKIAPDYWYESQGAIFADLFEDRGMADTVLMAPGALLQDEDDPPPRRRRRPRRRRSTVPPAVDTTRTWREISLVPPPASSLRREDLLMGMASTNQLVEHLLAQEVAAQRLESHLQTNG